MRNSFIVQYASHLWLASVGLTGPLGAIAGFIAKFILGDMLDKGLIKLDITIDKLKEAMKEAHWKEAAEIAYKNATSGVKTDEEKAKIRQQYLDALSAYATYGNGVPNNQNP